MGVLLQGAILGAIIIGLIVAALYLEWGSIHKSKKRYFCQYCGEDFGVCAPRTLEMHEMYCPKNLENIDKLRQEND